MAQQLSEQTFGVAVQFDGRIVVGGSRNVFDQVVLTRFLPTGAVDSSFGASGFATVPPPSHVIEGAGRALLLQPDGKLVVAGAVQRPNFGTAFREGVHLARYHGDGTVDTSFGTGGRVETWTPGRGMSADAVALDPTGRIIVAGCIEQDGPSFGQCKFSGPSTATNFFMARYSPAGVLDPTFGSAFAGIDIAGYWDAAAGIAVQSDGRIVAAGGASLDGSTQQRFALVRVFGGTVNCTATLLPAARSTGQAGSFGTIEVGLPPGCPWTATSNVPWMVVTAGSSGAGNGVVTYVFQENTTTAQRIGTLSVAGVSFALTQGPATAPALSTQPVEQTVAPGGQATFVSLATGDPPPTYRWQMSADGSSWSDVPAIPPYYGTNGRTLAIVPVPGCADRFSVPSDRLEQRWRGHERRCSADGDGRAAVQLLGQPNRRRRSCGWCFGRHRPDDRADVRLERERHGDMAVGNPDLRNGFAPGQFFDRDVIAGNGADGDTDDWRASRGLPSTRFGSHGSGSGGGGRPTPQRLVLVDPADRRPSADGLHAGG